MANLMWEEGGCIVRRGHTGMRRQMGCGVSSMRAVKGRGWMWLSVSSGLRCKEEAFDDEMCRGRLAGSSGLLVLLEDIMNDQGECVGRER